MDKDGRRLAYEVLWTCAHTGSIKEQHYPETSVHLRGMPRQKLILAGALSCHDNCIRCGLACVASRGHSLESSGRAPLLSASHLLSSSWCTCPHRAVCVRSHLRWVALPNPYLYACYPESGSSLWPHRHARLLEAVVCAAIRVCRGTKRFNGLVETEEGSSVWIGKGLAHNPLTRTRLPRQSPKCLAETVTEAEEANGKEMGEATDATRRAHGSILVLAASQTSLWWAESLLTRSHEWGGCHGGGHTVTVSVRGGGCKYPRTLPRNMNATSQAATVAQQTRGPQAPRVPRACWLDLLCSLEAHHCTDPAGLATDQEAWNLPSRPEVSVTTVLSQSCSL